MTLRADIDLASRDLTQLIGHDGAGLGGRIASFAHPSRIEDFNRIALWSGGAYALPKGWITLYELGPFLQLARWSPARLCWTLQKKPIGGLVPPFWCDGVSWRVVNAVGTTFGVQITNPGSGYSANNPPLIVPTRAPEQGRRKPALRATVGGAIRIGIEHGGVYDYPPTLVWNYGEQTPPYRPIQVSFLIDSNTGALTGILYDGNDHSAARGSTDGYAGSGLDVAKLAWQIVRHPEDTQTDNAVLNISVAGAGEVTAIDVTDFGCPTGNYDATAAFAITHHGGEGLGLRLYNDYYLTGISIVDGGDYVVRGGSTPYNSSSNDDYLPIFAYGDTDDEQSRPIWQPGLAVINEGGVTYCSHGGIGPGFQQRPFLSVGTPFGATVNRPARLAAILGSGDDYFSFEHVG